MSVRTQIESPGLARDSAPEVGSGANALRRAENIVIRSPGVMETRPSFDLLYEAGDTTVRIKALREFQGRLLMVGSGGAFGAWVLVNQDGLGFVPPGVSAGVNGFEPPNYNASESKFAEARASLHMTGQGGVVVIENQNPLVKDARLSGVDMRLQFEYEAADVDANQITIPSLSFAYRFVVVRTDSHGYIRRSPPSPRLVLTATNAPYSFGRGSRFNFSPELQAGDQIEFYRTRALVGMSPRPEHYLSVTYTITSADVAQGWFAPPIDATPESELGAELYTDDAELSVVASKYRPPQAQALALWQRCMWFGRTTSIGRLTLSLTNLYHAGVARWGIGDDIAREWLFTSGSPVVLATFTTGLTVGMPITDNLNYGPQVDGRCVPAGSYIISIVPDVSFTMNHDALATPGAAVPGVAYAAEATPGLMAFDIDAGSWMTGSPFVTLSGGLSAGQPTPMTLGMRVGMYFTTHDSAAGGSAVASAFPAGTKILEIVDSTTVRLDHNALTTSSGTVYAGDVVTVNGVDFYAWPLLQAVSSFSVLARRMFFIGRPEDSAELGTFNYGLTIQNLCEIINAQYFTDPTFRVYATPIGDEWGFRGLLNDRRYDDAGLRTDPGTLARALELESDFQTPIVVSSSCPAAFSPTLPQTSEDGSRPNRIYFSDVDEPESVPLINFIDIGSKTAPILSLVPLRNALLVFKSDGLWRITGSGPSSWSVDPLDMTMTLLRPELVSVSQNKAYCWAKGGFYECDESGSRSLSAGKLDVELREHALYLTSNTTHGAWVAVVQERNIVLLGIPTNLGGSFTEKVLCYHQTTGAWTEWPVSWGKVAESASFDRLYQSRPEEVASTGLLAIDVEVRRMLEGYNGIDRGYPLGDSLIVVGSVITIDDGDFGTWRPIAGDWISATDGELRVYRRILTAIHNGNGTWTITLEAEVPDGSGGDLITDTGVFFVTDGGVRFAIASLMGWMAHEAIRLAIEWHPTAPAGLPIGAIARELQFQLDLRKAPDPKVADSLPEYIAGGSNESRTSPSTVVSNMARVPTVQPLRMGITRQVARGANLAPYFATSDIYAFRLVGASIVYEGVSERTRR
jgi:hypothetical protein